MQILAFDTYAYAKRLKEAGFTEPQIEAQIEGSFVYGLSAALYGECTVKDGAIEQKNFDTYPMLRMNQMPKV